MKKIYAGFTMFELLFVMAVIMVLSATGLLYVNSYSGRNDVELAARELRNNLLLVRNYAVTYQRPITYSGDFNNVLFTINTTTGDISVKPDATNQTYPAKKMNLASITLTASMNPVGFAIDNGNLVNGSNTRVFTEAVYSLTSQISGKVKQVVVQPHGLVIIRDP